MGRRMSKSVVRVCWCVLPLLGLAIAGCGGGMPGDAVVSVDGNAINKATYNHWISVAATSSAGAIAGQTASKPVIPDPPAYTACISNLQSTESKPAKGQKKKTAVELKAQCEQRYKALQQQVLGFLITSDWVIGEAQNQGVKITDKEVVRHFNELKKQQFPKAAEFEKLLASTGETVSDLLLRVKLSMLWPRSRRRSPRATRRSPKLKWPITTTNTSPNTGSPNGGTCESC